MRLMDVITESEVDVNMPFKIGADMVGFGIREFVFNSEKSAFLKGELFG